MHREDLKGLCFTFCLSFYIGNVDFCLEVATIMTPKLVSNCNAISCFLIVEVILIYKP